MLLRSRAVHNTNNHNPRHLPPSHSSNTDNYRSMTTNHHQLSVLSSAQSATAAGTLNNVVAMTPPAVRHHVRNSPRNVSCSSTPAMKTVLWCSICRHAAATVTCPLCPCFSPDYSGPEIRSRSIGQRSTPEQQYGARMCAQCSEWLHSAGHKMCHIDHIVQLAK